jgi:hypothetical protein
MILEAEVGMLIVETIAKIRRAFFVQGKPIKAICRELRVSRKVVRKVIRSEATEFRRVLLGHEKIESTARYLRIAKRSDPIAIARAFDI